MDTGFSRYGTLGDTFVPGMQIADVWEVERPLGKGGMGSVYRCHNVHAPRIRAAIKLLHPSLAHDDAARARFLAEAEILSELNHPNVVRVSGVRLDQNRPFLEMEYVEGRSLESVLAEHAEQDPAEMLDWTLQIADALAYLHRERVFHHDLKPENILIRTDGQPIVVDFGLAMETTRAGVPRQEQVGFGTASYCPPEWLLGEETDPARWDVYAFGVLLFETVTGRVGFPTDRRADAQRSLMQVMTQKQDAPCLDPGEAVEPGIRALIRELTVRDPAGAPRDARDVADRLRTLLAPPPTLSPLADAAPRLAPAPPAPAGRSGLSPLMLTAGTGVLIALSAVLATVTALVVLAVGLLVSG